jgi:CRISPR-associated protein Cas6
MFWQQESEEARPYVVPDDIVDLSFKVSCRSLPLDHAYALSMALQEALPWLDEEAEAGVHLIHGAESGNGWIRPEGPNDILYLSRRTRMTLRLPQARVQSAKTTLQGRTLNVGGTPLTLGTTSVRKLSTLTTVFARYVIADNAEDEMGFLEQSAERLANNLGIRVKKMMGGRLHTMMLPERTLTTRSLMIDGLEVEESVSLQQQGLGPGRKLGCGLFLPHKGIGPVAQAQAK